jgi:hypothetical protein
MIRVLTVLVFGLLTTASAAVAQEAGAVLVKNGGFENDKKEWWGPGLKNEANEVVAEGAAEGKSSLKLATGWICQDKIKVEGGKRYRIAMKIRSESAPDNSIYVQLSYRGGNMAPKWYGPKSISVGDHEEVVVVATGGSHEWKEFSAVVQAPDKADQALIYLRRTQGEGAGYFDAVRMEPSQDAVTPQAGGADSGPAGGREGVTNGGFEKGYSGWWGPAIKGSTAQVVNENAAEGTACIKLSAQWLCQDKIAVQANKNYRVSLKIRSDQVADGAAFVQVSFRGENVGGAWQGPHQVRVGNHNEAAVAVSGGTHEWKEFSSVLEAPAGANQALIYLRKQGEQGTVYYDDVRLEATDAAAATVASIKRDELASKWLAPAGDAAVAAPVIAKVITAAANKTDSLRLADKGKALYRIHVGDKADIISLNAAVELAEHLEKMTGVSFAPLAHDAAPVDQPLLVVGRDNALTAKLCPDIAYDALGRDGFVIRTVGPHLVITGATPRGTLYGVYWFLDRHLGVRWFDPDFTVIPTKTQLTIRPISEKQTPRFSYREVFSHEAHNDRYAAHNLLNGRSHGRSFTPSVPEIGDWEDWYEVKGGVAHFWELLGDAVKTHPHWKAGGQVLMMDEQVRQTTAETIIAKLKALKDYRSVVFHINDMDWGWDMDKASREFANKHGGEPSAPRLDMVIDVANRVRKVLPEARFSFNAYHWSFTPPQGMTVPDYIIVNPMDIHVDYSVPLFEGPNEKLGQDIEGWCKIAKNVLFWDHTINFHGYIQPTPNLYPIGESIPWLAKHPQIFGYFCEDSWNTKGAEFANLRTWMIARLLWNPNEDYKALIKEFVDGYYGAAAPYVLQYIELMHESMAQTGDTLREKTTPDAPYLNLNFLMAADKLFAQAHDAVKGQPQFLKHVEITRMSVDCTILFRRFDFLQDAQKRGIAWDPDTNNRMKRLFANWEMSGIRMYKQNGTLKDLQTMLAIERKPAAKPDIVKGLPDEDWREYSDLTINRYGSFIVPDELASDGAALMLPGKSGGWIAQFRRYKLPKEGKWDVYAAVRIDRGNAAENVKALNIGISPPMGRAKPVTVGDLADGQYHWIKIIGSPMTYEQGDEHLLYFQPIKGAVENTYVDRVVAIRQK